MTTTTWRADAVVLLGATGDLARKNVLPALFQLARRRRLRVPVVGVARREWDDAAFAEHVRSVLREQLAPIDDAGPSAFVRDLPDDPRAPDPHPGPAQGRIAGWTCGRSALRLERHPAGELQLRSCADELRRTLQGAALQRRGSKAGGAFG